MTVVAAGEEDEGEGPLAVEGVDGLKWRMMCVVEEEEEEEDEPRKIDGEEEKEEEEEAWSALGRWD